MALVKIFTMLQNVKNCAIITACRKNKSHGEVRVMDEKSMSIPFNEEWEWQVRLADGLEPWPQAIHRKHK
jgi:hypothetical protein